MVKTWLAFSFVPLCRIMWETLCVCMRAGADPGSSVKGGDFSNFW